MGVLNITPDSFSDGGQTFSLAAAIERAAIMVEEGADLIDIGGESTRPQADPVSAEEELERILPVIEAITPLGVPISVDTRKTAVMRAVLPLGVSMINDVNALQDEGALALLAGASAQICLMHMQGQPTTMQQNPHYGNVVEEVYAFLAERISACENAGIDRDRLLIDPGFGFGKTLPHNLQLLGSLSRFRDLHCPCIVGLSRKSMFGLITGKPVDQRMPSSLVAAVISLLSGVSIIRTHDVASTCDAVKVLTSLRQELRHESAS